jgi:hypothetical protein
LPTTAAKAAMGLWHPWRWTDSTVAAWACAAHQFAASRPDSVQAWCAWHPCVFSSSPLASCLFASVRPLRFLLAASQGPTATTGPQCSSAQALGPCAFKPGLRLKLNSRNYAPHTTSRQTMRRRLNSNGAALLFFHVVC